MSDYVDLTAHPPLKHCTKCGEWTNRYTRHSSGNWRSECQTCKNRATTERRREKARQRKLPPAPAGSKRCCACLQIKPANLAHFYRIYTGSSTLQSRCKLCQRSRRAPQGKGRGPCGTCAGLSHRVRGPKCRECGIRYEALPPVQIENCLRSDWRF